MNISTGKVLPSIGGVGSETDCRRTVNDLAARQMRVNLLEPVASPWTQTALPFSQRRVDSIGECGEDTYRNVPVHDNSSRLIAYDMKYPQSAPITLCFADLGKLSSMMLRISKWWAAPPQFETNDHGTHIGVEVVTFDAKPVRHILVFHPPPTTPFTSPPPHPYHAFWCFRFNAE